MAFSPYAPVTRSNALPTLDASGAAGAVVETGTTALSGQNFFAVQCLTETVIASYTSSTLSGDSLAGVTLPAGTVIFGTFTAITLTSGAIIGYTAQ